MARPRKSRILDEFERVREPDFEALAKVVEEAKGGRTSLDFAALCGVHPSTISRIRDGKMLRKPISDELLVSIAVNAEQNNGEIFRDLLKAHGVEPRRGVTIYSYDDLLREKMQQLIYQSESYGVYNGNDSNKLENRVISNASEIILRELYAKGQRIRAMDPKDIAEEASHGVLKPALCDFAIEVNDVKHDQFEIREYFVLDGTSQKAIRRLEQVLSGAYLIHPIQQGIKLYTILFDTSMYGRLMDSLRGCRIRDSITLLLLDIRSRETIDSFEIPML